ncbi:MAG TPA: hypothetical protein VFK06_19505 [Candidatus Angelobacter sp.]|nr:hypothetical protein [Candidatus Angelobacter sp.]
MERLKILLILVVIAGAIFFAWKMFPPYYNNYQLQDDLDDLAAHATYKPTTDDDLRALVMQKATNHDITLKEEQVSVSQAGGVGITVHYRITVDLLVRQVDLDFTTNSLNRRL